MNTNVVNRLLQVQWGLTLILPATLLAIDKTIALSVMVGGLVIVVPGALLALYWSGRQPDFFRLMMGEAAKLLISVIIFILIFVNVRPLAPVWMFGMLILTQLTWVVIPLLMDRQKAKEVNSSSSEADCEHGLEDISERKSQT